MSGWAAGLGYALVFTLCVNAGAYFGAGIAAEWAKTEGRVPSDKPPFLLFFHDPFAARLIEQVYTDLHRDYGSRFLTGCIRILRITLPLTVVLFIANAIAVFV
ncbi:hypothetical protein [Brevundimonas sp.]|uniref:hypothetical protein n=1 Tax=Brevundimonas sp. TaxID=1871086 RepID=UPI002EDB8EE5